MIYIGPLAIIILLAGVSLPVTAQSEDVTNQVNPAAFVNALEDVFGKHQGFRRTHAKGLCATGYFEGTSEGRALSVSSAFSGDRIPVVARYSVGGGNPNASEKSKSVRGMALQFTLPDDERWMMANISTPMFLAATPQNVLAFFEARAFDPEFGGPNPERVAAFNAAHPDVQPQIEYLANDGVPASYAALSYFSTHAFKFVDSAGAEIYARWSFVPDAGQERLTDEELSNMSDSFLAEDLRKRVGKAPVGYDFRLKVAGEGDSLVNPTETWPDGRKEVTAGRLVIESVAADDEGECVDINFNPHVLPSGVELSDDPVLKARAAPYAISHARRRSGN